MTSADWERTRDLIDRHEGRAQVPLLDDVGIAELLRSSRRIAVVGASPSPDRPSFGVFKTLLAHGYDCVPVNPHARDVLGVTAYKTLAEAVDAGGSFDIVDIFRRPELCVPHAFEAVETSARCLWLQLGIVNWDAGRIAHDAGLSVVMDRCTAIELRRLV